MRAIDFLKSIKSMKLRLIVLNVLLADVVEIIQDEKKFGSCDEDLSMLRDEQAEYEAEIKEVYEQRRQRVLFLITTPGLKDNWRRVLLLHYVDELTFKKVAEKMAYSLANIALLNRKAVAALDDILKQNTTFLGNEKPGSK